MLFTVVTPRGDNNEFLAHAWGQNEDNALRLQPYKCF